MASTQAPPSTAVVAQAVNMSVNDAHGKAENDSEALPTSASVTSDSTTPAPIPVATSAAASLPENVSTKPTTDAPTETKEAASAQGSDPNTPDIPVTLSTQKPSDDTAHAKSLSAGGDIKVSEESKPVPKIENSHNALNAESSETSMEVGQESRSDKDELKSQTKESSEGNNEVGSDKVKSNNDNSLPDVDGEKPLTGNVKESNNLSSEAPTASATTTANGKSLLSTTNASSVTSTATTVAPTTVSKPVATIKPMVECADGSAVMQETKPNPPSNNDTKISNNKRPAEDSDEPDKRLKTVSSSPAHPSSSSSAFKGSGKSPEQVLEYMEKTFDHRRKIITKQMPTIPELKGLYPDLFRDKQLVIEFQRITKIDIDQKIQEFCVRNATAVIEMARGKKEAQPVLARWEQAKQENEALKQYWDMVTALCLLPLHFGENFVEMVLEIEEDEMVQAQGKIVPTLVARGNIFRTDEFFLIAENTIVQEFEEFTIAFASLYSSYWVFNMVYPETIENTYNFIQRCIVKQKEPGAIPTVCKNFTKTLQKWNKSMKKT